MTNYSDTGTVFDVGDFDADWDQPLLIDTEWTRTVDPDYSALLAESPDIASEAAVNDAFEAAWFADVAEAGSNRRNVKARTVKAKLARGGWAYPVAADGTVPDGIANSASKSSAELAAWLKAGHRVEYVAPGTLWDSMLTDDRDVSKEVRRLHVRSKATRQYAQETSAFGQFQAADAMSADDLIEDESTARPCIEGVIDAASLTCLLGETYTGKSYVSLAWAFCIATGTPWLGHAVTQGRVLYLAMEGRATLLPRLRALKAHYGVDSVGDRLVIHAKVTNFFDAQSVTNLAELIRDGGFSAVFVDTVSRSFGGNDENKPEAMGTYVAALDQLKEANPGAAVVILAHPNRENPNRPRGHSSLEAALDALWTLPKPERKGDPYREMNSLKWKMGKPRESVTMGFTEIDGTESSVLISSAKVGDDTVRVLAAMLAEYGEVTRAMLKEKLVGNGLYGTPNSAGNRITALVAQGSIVATSNRSDGVLTLGEAA